MAKGKKKNKGKNPTTETKAAAEAQPEAPVEETPEEDTPPDDIDEGVEVIEEIEMPGALDTPSDVDLDDDEDADDEDAEEDDDEDEVDNTPSTMDLILHTVRDNEALERAEREADEHMTRQASALVSAILKAMAGAGIEAPALGVDFVHRFTKRGKVKRRKYTMVLFGAALAEATGMSMALFLKGRVVGLDPSNHKDRAKIKVIYEWLTAQGYTQTSEEGLVDLAEMGEDQTVLVYNPMTNTTWTLDTLLDWNPNSEEIPLTWVEDDEDEEEDDEDDDE